ncbi:MAG: hypothetical protein AAF513_03545 [Pseudomonadota bacterium]
MEGTLAGAQASSLSPSAELSNHKEVWILTNLRTAIFASVWIPVFFLLGCAGNPPGLTEDWNQQNNSVSVIYVPPEQPIYVEIHDGGRRYAEVEIEKGKELLAGFAGGAIGTYIGTASALMSLGISPSHWTSFVEPNSAIATVVLLPLLRFGSIAVREARAKKLAQRFRDLDLSTEYFPDQLKQTVHATGLGFGDIVFRSIEDAGFREAEDFVDYLDPIDTDVVIVLSAIPSFTPKFEVYQQEVFFGVAQRLEEGVFTITYNNQVVVQSQLRSVLAGGDAAEDWTKVQDSQADKRLNRLYKTTNYKHMSDKDRRIAVQSIRRDFARKAKREPADYRPLDLRDENGDMWYANDGAALRSAIAETTTEAIRLVLADLRDGHRWDVATAVLARPPGFKRKMFETTFDTDQRRVYRQRSGALVSVVRGSRMIPHK